MCERLINLPNIRETSLDDGLIEALIPNSAPTLLPSGAIVRMETHNIAGLRRFGAAHWDWDFPQRHRWETADIAILVQLAVRDQMIRPLVGKLVAWLNEQRRPLSPKSETAKALDYGLKRMPAFTRFLDDGRICLSNNAAERAMRCVAIGRKNWTFAGSDAGGRRAAAIYTLIETCKLNDVDPRTWLADVLRRLPDHPAKRIRELLPWNWVPEPAIARAA